MRFNTGRSGSKSPSADEPRHALDQGAAGAERSVGAGSRAGAWADDGAARRGDIPTAAELRAAARTRRRSGGGGLPPGGGGRSFGRRVSDAVSGAIGRFVDRVMRFAVGLGVLVAAVGVWVSVVVGAATWEKMQLLPDSAALMDGRQRGSVTVLDKDGQKLGVRGQRFARITADDASKALINAVLSAEDRRFYWHLGLDPIGLARALTVNYRLGYTAQGGSTITQQVAKLAFLSQARTISRKLEEVPFALALELAYTKDEILSIYLNRAYLGSASFGFEAAARRYFGRSARSVTPAQAALLAGLLRAPSRWSPEADFAAAQERAKVVLGAMVDAGAISEADRRSALVEVSAMTPRTPTEYAPHFVDWIADERVTALLSSVDPAILGGKPEEIDVVVSTTLDRKAQAAAEEAIAKTFESHPKVKRNQEAEAAAVILSSMDASVRGMVGGRTYGDSVFNRATAAKRQVGSAFKPVVFAAAIERGLHPNAGVRDAPVRIGSWRPKNYSRRYRGWITLEQALSYSSNTAAVRLMSRVGARRVVQMAEKFGYPEGVTPYPSIALGAIEASPLEVAGAYAVFARRGRDSAPFAITEIRTPAGETIWRRESAEDRQVIRTSTAGWITSMMRSVVEIGTGRRARLPDRRPVAGKTGTTQSARDVWFAGFTGDYVGVFWVGRDDNVALKGKVVGGNLPAEIWRDAMTPLHTELKMAALPQRRIPGGAQHASVQQLEDAAKARAEAEAAALAEGLTAEEAAAAGAAAAVKVAPTLRRATKPTAGRPGRIQRRALRPPRVARRNNGVRRRAAAPERRFWPPSNRRRKPVVSFRKRNLDR